ncbi:MAG: sigma-54 dependent transcriptional regulator [Fibrobacteraceae bacterium]|jgi:DNA-binding NtrC family response regulator|nr:sigma-54-dependent Fis family transcriptional regulator [Fibrobacteraceae bacterium]MEE1277016.1 sigma-54 dependent transcriptional regulator [Fibrobacteraceae bacterium]
MQILLADPDAQFVHSVFDSWHLPESVLLPVLTERELIATIEQKSIDLAFINVQLLLHDGLDIVSFLKERHPIAEIIVLADHASGISIAENALTRGASRYLKKPIKISALEEIAQKCKQQQRETSANRLMEDHVLDSLLGDTPEMRKILKTVYKIAPTTSTVLITGESGSGKEFLANVVHRLSKRSSEPFVAVNCGAIPENIVESELFGSRKGAFTGAIADKKGLFEAASGGTLFLDEVGELSLATQVKLLRFLQNKEIRRVGDSENRYLDVRIIAATNKNLKQAMLEGKFREDLYYRLNTFHLHLPPLRERQIVIPRLVSYFILKYKQEHGKEVNGLDSAAQMALAAYRYPGNIRELENIIEHAIVLSEGGIIRLEDLPETVLQENLPSARMLLSLQEQQPEEPLPLLPDLSGKEKILTLGELERQYIIHTLTQLKGEKLDEIAKILGISRTTLWRKIKENNIEFSE